VIFLAQKFIKPSVIYLSMVKMKIYRTEKLVLFRISLGIFSSQIYQALGPLFMNGKCEKLSIQKHNLI
jgi:hypothetical protein